MDEKHYSRWNKPKLYKSKHEQDMENAMCLKRDLNAISQKQVWYYCIRFKK